MTASDKRQSPSQEPAKPRFVDRYLEYLILLALAFGLAGAIAYWAQQQDSSPAEPRSASAVSRVPTCTDAGITAATRKTGTCSTPSAVLTFVNDKEPLQLPQLGLRLIDAVGLTATSPSGLERERMRVEVRLKLANTGDEQLSAGDNDDAIFLSLAHRRVQPDPAARELPGVLRFREPIGPGEARVGVLRFELAGAETREFLKRRGADLAIRPAAFGAAASPDRIGVVRFRADEIRRAD
jgi:hypothetical protein